MATLAGVTSSGCSTNIDSAQRSRRWQCSLETGQQTLQQTTQRVIRDYTNIIGGRKLRATQYQLHYRGLHCEVYTDTYIGPCKSLLEIHAVKYMLPNFSGHVLTLCPAMTVYKPATLKNCFAKLVFHRQLYPTPRWISQKESFFTTTCWRSRCIYAQFSSWLYKALRLHRRIMLARNVPKVLWDSCCVYCCEILSLMALGHHEQEGECGTTIIQGSTANGLLYDTRNRKC